MVGEAWKLIKRVESGYDRASALAAIAPLLPAAAEKDLTRAVGMAIGSIMDEYDQASAIILLAPLLTEEKTKSDQPPLNRLDVLREGLSLALQAPTQRQRVALLTEGVRQWVDTIPVTERFP